MSLLHHLFFSLATLAMWCCREVHENRIETDDLNTEEVEEEHIGVKDIDVKEWNITLRENIVCLDEHNVLVKTQKIEAIEQVEAERRVSREKYIEEIEKELMLQQQLLEATRLELEQERDRDEERRNREQNLEIQQHALDEQEKDLVERKAVLEIVVHMNENDQKLSLPLRNELEEQEASHQMLARETQLEEKEEELFLRQREIEEREFEIDEKNAVLKVAIRGNDHRKANTTSLTNYLLNYSKSLAFKTQKGKYVCWLLSKSWVPIPWV